MLRPAPVDFAELSGRRLLGKFRTVTSMKNLQVLASQEGAPGFEAETRTCYLASCRTS